MSLLPPPTPTIPRVLMSESITYCGCSSHQKKRKVFFFFSLFPFGWRKVKRRQMDGVKLFCQCLLLFCYCCVVCVFCFLLSFVVLMMSDDGVFFLLLLLVTAAAVAVGNFPLRLHPSAFANREVCNLPSPPARNRMPFCWYAIAHTRLWSHSC